MEQQGTVNNRTFVLLNFRSVIVATPIEFTIPICSMYAIFTNICPTDRPVL